MGIGKQIRKYREKAGWTLDDLSGLSQVDTGTISAPENRDSNSSKYFIPIARAFGLTIEQLADEAVDFAIQNTRATETGAIPLVAKDRSKLYGWPFDIEKVTPEQYAGLEPEQRALIEQLICQYLKARADPKQQAPANTVAGV